MTWLTDSQLKAIGFSSLGKNVLISEKTSIYNPSNISIGNNVRIDDFCVLSAGTGGIEIENHVHIAIYSSLIGSEKIHLSDFSGLSSRVSIYSSNDDYSGKKMTNPTVPPEYTGVTHGKVFLGKHVIVGSGSIILPGATLEDGVAIAALSLVSKKCESFNIYAGVPARKIKERHKDLLELEAQLTTSTHFQK